MLQLPHGLLRRLPRTQGRSSVSYVWVATTGWLFIWQKILQPFMFSRASKYSFEALWRNHLHKKCNLARRENWLWDCKYTNPVFEKMVRNLFCLVFLQRNPPFFSFSPSPSPGQECWLAPRHDCHQLESSCSLLFEVTYIPVLLMNSTVIYSNKCAGLLESTTPPTA